MEIKKVQPALPKSYERLCHATGHPRFMLGLRNRAELTSAQGLGKPQLERAIGVVYRPRPSAPVTISRRSCRGNSMSTSGSMTPALSRRSTPRSLRDCLIPIPLGCESVAMPACKDITYVLDKLSWMRAERIWPNGQRYTWTDAFGVVLLVSLYAELGKRRFLDEAEWVVSDVDRVLGRPRGIRIGEAPDRDGQYFHYLAMWLYALSVLARYVPAYGARASILRTKFTPHLLCREEASFGR